MARHPFETHVGSFSQPVWLDAHLFSPLPDRDGLEDHPGFGVVLFGVVLGVAKSASGQASKDCDRVSGGLRKGRSY
ncbi:hypothetical protein MPNT_30090 [Candidatus Methylacidithermus pantelleriae]|uniref:Uncharacterized protein n=1 Tax=Candidatus Methylacidithermus pantelleriae TaxID=2744239 RepID=A0A8J2FSW2_9BACT|nr:hypothetical protein MPNT_30090 [Candidatus Methylacidithermus pantelleriae]